MSVTTAERDALKTAMASGVLEVTFNGKTVKYDSFRGMKQRLQWIESELTARPTRVYGRFTKGLTL